MAASYYDNEDLSRDRTAMLSAAIGIHAVLTGIIFLLYYDWNMALGNQLFHGGNRTLLSLLVLASASCLVSVMICIAVTGAQMKRSTAWLLGLLAAPALLGTLAAIVLIPS